MKQETRTLSIAQALDLGVEMAVAGNHANAITMFRGVLVHEPENFEAIERLGSSLFETKQYHEALYWFWRGRKLEPRHPMALTNYGLCVSHLGHCEEAVDDLTRAAKIAYRKDGLSNEARALIYNNLGNTLERLRRYDEALPVLDKGIAANPNDPFPHYNRGIVLLRLNRHSDAIDSLNRSLALDPGNADAQYNRAMARLLLGDLAGGFEDYESRLLTSENEKPNLGLPAERRWQGAHGFGEEIFGKTILVHAEQGLGDTIQFLRFVPTLVKYYGAKVLLRVQTALTPLAAAIHGVTVLEVEAGATIEGYDYWVALMSLPLMLGLTTSADIRPPAWGLTTKADTTPPRLITSLDNLTTIRPPPWAPAIEPERIETWRAQLPPRGCSIRIGVCWSGSFQHKNDRNRSIPIKEFATLFDTPGCEFVSVQQMRPEDAAAFPDIQQRHSNVTALWLEDFRDTAAVLLHCDIVVTVDTAVAHLAASLGIPTWILIPQFACDWRWQLARSDSPWYPSVTLYRQRKAGDWTTTLAAVRLALTQAAAAQQAA